jgi:hypothetical protein
LTPDPTQDPSKPNDQNPATCDVSPNTTVKILFTGSFAINEDDQVVAVQDFKYRWAVDKEKHKFHYYKFVRCFHQTKDLPNADKIIVKVNNLALDPFEEWCNPEKGDVSIGGTYIATLKVPDTGKISVKIQDSNFEGNGPNPLGDQRFRADIYSQSP